MSIAAKRLDGSRGHSCNLVRSIDLDPGHIVLDGVDPPKKGHSPQFSAHVYCGYGRRTAERICAKFTLKTCINFGPSLGRL